MSGDLLVAAHVHPSSLSVLFSSWAVEVIRPRAVRCAAGIFRAVAEKPGPLARSRLVTHSAATG